VLSWLRQQSDGLEGRSGGKYSPSWSEGAPQTRVEGRLEPALVRPDETEVDDVPPLLASSERATHLLPSNGEIELGIDVVLL
jgi:hypothetical protein